VKSIKRILKAGLLLSLLFSLHSCTPYYAFGNNGVDPIAFIKPVYADSASVTTYIGGKYTHTIDSAYNHKNEVNYFGQLNWSQTRTSKYYNFSYGAFGYLGSYKVAKLEDFKGNKEYYGGGVSSEFCLNIPLRSVDLRLIGIKGTFYYENGDFTKFRRTASAQNLISGVSASQFAYNISLTSGYELKYKKSGLGFDGSTGMTYFMNDKAAFLTCSLNGHYTYKRYTVYVLYTESAFGIGEEYALGFSYRLK
jgi:hypothetical protein